MKRRFGRKRPSADQGSSVPLILLCFLVASLLVAGVTAASAAFLAQRDLQADCDGAAIRAASALDPETIMNGGLSEAEILPLAIQVADQAVADYQARGFPADETLTMTAALDNDKVTVVCRRRVQLPFGAVFGFTEGLDRETISTARSPLR